MTQSHQFLGVEETLELRTSWQRRGDGSNSLIGLDPDLCAGWVADDEHIARLRKVVQALRRL